MRIRATLQTCFLRAALFSRLAMVGILMMGISQIAGQTIPTPTAKEWADLAKLPDWSGTWTPALLLQGQEIRKNPTPWTPAVAKQIAQMEAEEKAGHPRGLFVNCLPEGMPSWMMISHNALEFLFTPGRVTLLGESDGNRLRRIYTDGRAHPDDPDLTFHGHSIGHWEGGPGNGGTLVVDTVGILPESLIAIEEAVGIPNNGDMHIVERIHLTGADTLQDDMELTAPHVLAKPWKTSRVFYRQRARKFDIVEGVCRQGDFMNAKDRDGNAVFAPLPPVGRPAKP
jgi:hypothetical protein